MASQIREPLSKIYKNIDIPPKSPFEKGGLGRKFHLLRGARINLGSLLTQYKLTQNNLRTADAEQNEQPNNRTGAFGMFGSFACVRFFSVRLLEIHQIRYALLRAEDSVAGVAEAW